MPAPHPNQLSCLQHTAIAQYVQGALPDHRVCCLGSFCCASRSGLERGQLGRVVQRRHLPRQGVEQPQRRFQC